MANKFFLDSFLTNCSFLQFMFDGEKNSFRNAVNKKETDNYPTQVVHMEFRVKLRQTQSRIRKKRRSASFSVGQPLIEGLLLP